MAFKRLEGATSIDLLGGPTPDPHFDERWKAAFIRFLLETPGSAQDFFDLPLDARLAMVKAEPDPTEESVERTEYALAVLSGAVFEPKETVG